MYLGIDLGTSSIKAVLLDDEGQVLATATSPLTLIRRHPTWSEQDPRQWWSATLDALAQIKAQTSLSGLKAVGLSGQMHGATLLDEKGDPLRPAILWNDGRSAAQCRQLEEQVPSACQITGNRIMPGFTAPKLLWVADYEPAVFMQTRMVVLPKDYIRFRLTGDFASDMSDAAGTMWLDVGQRDWSDLLLAACRLDRQQMPQLYEGPHPTGNLTTEWADYLGCGRIPVIAGAGDNAAGALGVGLTEPGQAMISLGTSGTYFLVTDDFRQNSTDGVHSFCHALPAKWHVMSVILSAASCLSWLKSVTGADSVERLLLEAEEKQRPHDHLYFLPYLAGERTPHNNPNATGMFYGLTHDVERGHLAYAVLEGVSLAMCDGADAVHQATPRPEAAYVIGGGARSAQWTQLLCDAMKLPLSYGKDAEVGPALGAALLARFSITGVPARHAFPTPIIQRQHEPNLDRWAQLMERREIFQKLYQRSADLSSRPTD